MEFDEQISKEYLFSFLTQEEIFEKYLGTKVVLNKKITNPIRGDKHPTVTFKWFGDNLVMADYNGWFTGNCIQLVMKLNYCTYQKALDIIYRDFQLNVVRKTKINFIPKPTEPKLFKTYKETLSDYNYQWWSEYKITPEILDYYEVLKCREAHVGKYDYYYSDKDPCYHYTVRNQEGEFKEKLYFPLRKEYRFMSNIDKNSWYVQGLWQLKPMEDFLIITKSLKDVMAMYRFDIPAIALNSESTPLYEPVLEYLSNRYSKIYINMDYDYAGIKMMNSYKRKGFPLLFFKNKESKDFADYCKINNERQIVNFIKKIKHETN